MKRHALILMLCALTGLIGCGAITGAVAEQAHVLTGIAAYYSPDYKGKTANGEMYDPRKFTAAHKTLPFGTKLKVTDKRSGRTVEVVVNDRGPFTKGRMIDLSLAAAKELRIIDRGLAPVTASIQP
jgi:rare lipoprotein A